MRPLTAAQVAASRAREALPSAIRRRLTRPVSVLPSEQDRLISAQRQGRSVVRRGPDTTTESHTPVTTQLSAVTATTGAGGQVTAIAFH